MGVTAIYGGTFNPFHIGHYEVLSTLCEQDFIDKVLLLPDRLPPHKQYDYRVPDADRIKMCEIVCEDFKKAQLCLVDFSRKGKSYTVDTIKILRKKYPDEEFTFFCGGDMIVTLDKWYCFKELIKLTEFLTIKRADQTDEDFDSNVERIRNLGAKITVINKDITGVSSSEMRKGIKKELMPKKVYNYIIEKGLYNE